MVSECDHNLGTPRRSTLLCLIIVIIISVPLITSSSQSHILLKGLTVLEPPFIYSESGPYRGFSIDVLDEIAHKLSFNYTLQQSPDGQIGSASLLNGIYGELSRSAFDLAIGDISRNWLNNEKAASSVGVLFTKPIFISRMSVLLSKPLLQELEYTKQRKCLDEMIRSRENNGSRTPRVGVSYCSQSVRLDDIYESSLVTRIALKGSAIHEFYSTLDRKYLPLINWVEKASLFGYGLDKLKSHNYVLLDESKFTHYLADQDDRFDLIDVAYAYNDGTGNVRFDDYATAYVGDYKARQFRNEIVIALSKTTVQHFRDMNDRDLLKEFNHVIETLRKSGRLRQLQDKHWRHTFRRFSANSAVLPPAGVGIAALLAGLLFL